MSISWSGEISPVEKSGFDLRYFKKLDVLAPDGYDHNFCCKLENNSKLIEMAILKSQKSGRTMKIFGTQVIFHLGSPG